MMENTHKFCQYVKLYEIMNNTWQFRQSIDEFGINDNLVLSMQGQNDDFLMYIYEWLMARESIIRNTT